MALLISFDECSKQPQPDHRLLTSNSTSGFNHLLTSKEFMQKNSKLLWQHLAACSTIHLCYWIHYITIPRLLPVVTSCLTNWSSSSIFTTNITTAASIICGVLFKIIFTTTIIPLSLSCYCSTQHHFLPIIIHNNFLTDSIGHSWLVSDELPLWWWDYQIPLIYKYCFWIILLQVILLQ